MIFQLLRDLLMTWVLKRLGCSWVFGCGCLMVILGIALLVFVFSAR